MRNKDDSIRPVSWEDLDKYLAGENDLANKHEIEENLAEIPNSELVLRSQGIFSDSESEDPALGVSPTYKSAAESWNALESRLNSGLPGLASSHPSEAVPSYISHKGVGNRVSSFRSSRLKFSVQFASVAALVAFAWFAGVGKVRNDLSTYASIYSTQAGRQASLTLPDGTDVILNVGSRLEVGGGFLASNRKVKLVGQAKFVVKHKTGTPFTVETSTGAVTVLGTEFVVRDYEWDTLKTVSVWDGKVGVGTNIVSAGEQLSISPQPDGTQITLLSRLDTTSNSFANGVLIVKDRRLEDIVSELSTWYAIDIKFGDSQTRNRKISGRFQLGSVSELVEVLAWTLDVRSERSGDQITLYSK